MDHGDGEVLWSPAADALDRTRMGRFVRHLEAAGLHRYEGYEALWRWSVDEIEAFWAAFVDHAGVLFHDAPRAVLSGRTMPGAHWFEGATLSFAEHALALDGVAGDAEVLVSVSQTRARSALTKDGLRSQVARCAAGLSRLGVTRGDRVAAYLPNIAETVVAFVATASLGAVWASCAPEFGTRSVVDRLSQIEPKVLLAVDGYRFGDKAISRAGEAAAIRAALPSLRATVAVPYLDGPVEGADLTWDDLLAGPEPALSFEPVPFDHPLYILSSSGTTGLPKQIVHGHGGITVEHLKALGLHHDLGPADRFFWFSTTGWMMWNYLVSGLLCGSTIVCFDGNPGWPDLSTLWRLAADERLTAFGASAPFLMACRKEGLLPGRDLDLGALRMVGSTGAPLPADGFRWVRDAVGPEVQPASISGGTDIASAFVGAAPLVPVRAGVIPCRLLGARVEAYDEDRHPVVGRQGELVVTAPMPSMPVGFWGDADGSRYRAAYFEEIPGVWRHGDWITLDEHGGSVISGRSDATLNRGGVRLGTAELYAVVEDRPGVVDSLVVHLEDGDGGAGELVLFVVLAPGAELGEVAADVAGALRRELSPRHAPDRVLGVHAVPRTLSGKKLEVPVKRILQGEAVERAAAAGALADARALEEYVRLAATWRNP